MTRLRVRHGGGPRCSIRRMHADHPHDPELAVEVHYTRGAEGGQHDVYDLAMWWADCYAESEPGTRFCAVPDNFFALPYYTQMPRDFPAVELPEDATRYDAVRREQYERRQAEARAALEAMEAAEPVTLARAA